VGILVDARRLRFEMACRGWSGVDLAREANLSQATVSAALAGRAISGTSVALIAKSLLRISPIESIENLISPDID